MEGFSLFEMADLHSSIVDKIRQMYTDGRSRKDISAETGIHPVTIDKYISQFKKTKEVEIPRFSAKQRYTPKSEEQVRKLNYEGKTRFEIYKLTGLSYTQINSILGIEGEGAPRRLTDDQKSKIVFAATKLFCSTLEIAKIMGIKNRTTITKIIAPYLTPEIEAQREKRRRLLYSGNKINPHNVGITLDQIPSDPDYRPADNSYFRPTKTIEPTPIEPQKTSYRHPKKMKATSPQPPTPPPVAPLPKRTTNQFHSPLF